MRRSFLLPNIIESKNHASNTNAMGIKWYFYSLKPQFQLKNKYLNMKMGIKFNRTLFYTLNFKEYRVSL